MISRLFLGFSLVGADWVLYLLIAISVLSVAVILERWKFYRDATRGLPEFRARLREAAGRGQWDVAGQIAQARAGQAAPDAPDLETLMAASLLEFSRLHPGKAPDVLEQVAQDAVLRARLRWDRNLTVLATIGNNAPFIGLFGTVLGIIRAFHDLGQQAGAAAQTVTSGISESLVATAVGILVALPAVVAFNLFQRRVRAAVTESEALKSYLVGKLAG